MESIGQMLKAARERRQISISDVTAATKMTSAFVEAIEADNFDALVAPIYARGFIKLYAECVGLDPMPLLKQFSATLRAAPALPQPPVPARPAQAPSPALPMKAPVARAGKLKSPHLQQSGPLPRHGATGKPALEVVSGRSKARGGATLTTAAPAPVGRWPTLNWTFISRVRWPRFKMPNETLRHIQLPFMVWRQIFVMAGVVLLIIAAGLAWAWSNRGMPSMTDACRWLAEPPAPYLTMEARTPTPGR
jgi:hypothetical protein